MLAALLALPVGAALATVVLPDRSAWTVPAEVRIGEAGSTGDGVEPLPALTPAPEQPSALPPPVPPVPVPGPATRVVPPLPPVSDDDSGSAGSDDEGDDDEGDDDEDDG